jgi:hypothetical protein
MKIKQIDTHSKLYNCTYTGFFVNHIFILFVIYFATTTTTLQLELLFLFVIFRFHKKQAYQQQQL